MVVGFAVGSWLVRVTVVSHTSQDSNTPFSLSWACSCVSHVWRFSRLYLGYKKSGPKEVASLRPNCKPTVCPQTVLEFVRHFLSPLESGQQRARRRPRWLPRSRHELSDSRPSGSVRPLSRGSVGHAGLRMRLHDRRSARLLAWAQLCRAPAARAALGSPSCRGRARGGR